MIRKCSTSVAELLNSKKGSLLHAIKHQYEIIKIAQTKLLSFDLPYFRHTHVCFFNGKKLVLKTEIPELIAKFRELKKDLIALLNTNDYFKHLSTLELVLVFESKGKRTTTKTFLSNKAQATFKNLENKLEDGQIKDVIYKFLSRHDKT